VPNARIFCVTDVTAGCGESAVELAGALDRHHVVLSAVKNPDRILADCGGKVSISFVLLRITSEANE
jgi:hypothetical protein